MRISAFFSLSMSLSACASLPSTSSQTCLVSEAERGSVEAARDFIRRCAPDEAIALTRKLIAFRTVSAEGLAKDNPAFQEMRTFLEHYAAEGGMQLQRHGDDDAWEISLGHGPRRLGFVMHADVVPGGEGEVPEGWTGPPFNAWIQDGKLYGRGAEDDKGPIAAVLVAMHTLQRFGLVSDAQIVAMLGTAEEHEWDGMVRYAKTSTKPEHVISIDASYPVVIAESGFVAWQLELPLDHPRSLEPGKQPRIERADAGQFLTQVPGEASMTLLPARGQTPDELRAKLETIAQTEVAKLGPGFEFELRSAGPRVHLKTRGHAVHSSEADQGHNAMWLLARIGVAANPEPNAVAEMLRVLDAYFVADHFGERLGLQHDHPVMGRLLVIPTLLHTEAELVSLGVNMRRPAGKTKAEFEALLDQALAKMKSAAPKLATKDRWVGEPAMADTSGALVPTLMQIYRQVSGDQEAQPISIRGGTYARLFPGAVSFGPSRPGRTYTGHGPDEHIDLAVLKEMLEMIFEAAVTLGRPH